MMAPIALGVAGQVVTTDANLAMLLGTASAESG
jgi:hypothetical protein